MFYEIAGRATEAGVTNTAAFNEMNFDDNSDEEEDMDLFANFTGKDPKVNNDSEAIGIVVGLP